MGRSVTCTFSVHVQLEHSEVIYGAMSLKQAKGVLLSEIEYRDEKHLPKPQGANIWAQTKSGERMMNGFDFMHMSNSGQVERKMIS